MAAPAQEALKFQRQLPDDGLTVLPDKVKPAA